MLVPELWVLSPGIGERLGLPMLCFGKKPPCGRCTHRGALLREDGSAGVINKRTLLTG
jgi:hypothetical protein